MLLQRIHPMDNTGALLFNTVVALCKLVGVSIGGFLAQTPSPYAALLTPGNVVLLAPVPQGIGPLSHLAGASERRCHCPTWGPACSAPLPPLTPSPSLLTYSPNPCLQAWQRWMCGAAAPCCCGAQQAAHCPCARAPQPTCWAAPLASWPASPAFASPSASRGRGSTGESGVLSMTVLKAPPPWFTRTHPDPLPPVPTACLL